MTRLAEIQDRARSMGELFDIVGAMRSLAAMRVQEAERALPAILRYADMMAAAIGSALLLVPEPAIDGRAPAGRRALVLFTAEHGFVGGFNERLVEQAAATLGPRDLLFVLGSRGAALALERGWKATWTAPMATRPASAPEVVQRLSAQLYDRIARGEISRVDVIYARHGQGSAAAIDERLLLPLDLAALKGKQPAQPPLHNLEPQALLEKLMAEYVLALLTEAAVEAVASENAARFAAMESAHDNVAKKLDELRQAGRQARQSEITAELLDLVTGAEALAAT
jgi:F-type H+-transporting ATPase subunit gamma